MEADEFLSEYEALAPALRAWARLKCLGPLGKAVSADDLEQEVCLAAWSARERYDSSKGAFRPWLFGVASRVAAEGLRRLARGRLLPGQPLSQGRAAQLPAEWTTVSRRARREESVAQVLVDLEQLAEDDRQVFVFHGIEGLTHAEVAELMGWTEANAAKRWQRIRVRLQDLPSARGLLDKES